MSKKLDPKPLNQQTEKKEPHRDCCNCGNNSWETTFCSGCDSNFSLWKPMNDSGGEKELTNRENGLNHSYVINGEPTAHHSKLPELICPFCGRKLIRYKQAWICGHGCTKPALKPKEKLHEPKEEKCGLIKNAKGDPNWDSSLNAELCKGDCGTCPYYEPETEPELINTSEPLYPKVVYQLGSDSKEYIELKKKYDNLIEGFINFIGHFEERYEGNKCGECLEYWKTIKEHYKGV